MSFKDITPLKTGGKVDITTLKANILLGRKTEVYTRDTTKDVYFVIREIGVKPKEIDKQKTLIVSRYIVTN